MKRLIFSLLSFLMCLTQAWIISHELIHSKPFKVTYLDGFYEFAGYFLVPLRGILVVLLNFTILRRMSLHILPLISAIAFPLIFWGLYQIAFLLSGYDVTQEGGPDFSTWTAENSLSHTVLSCLFIGSIAALIVANVGLFLGKKDRKHNRKGSKYTLEELVSGITSENRHDEIDTGTPVGKEVW